MNFFFDLLLATNATSWMLIVYAIKEKITVSPLPYWLFHIMLVMSILLVSGITLLLSRLFGKETLNTCEEIALVDNEFLPVYLGYFFVSLSISDCYTMALLYVLVLVFTLLSKTQYFNPAYLFFGYHYYHVLTPNKTMVFIIKRGKVIRNRESIDFQNLRRINNTTFIERR